MAKLAFLAAGSGSPGAEEALRAAAAAAVAEGAEAAAVRGGFEGLLAHGAGPLDGRPLGAGRCDALREAAGPARAKEALGALGADALVVAGGEGAAAACQALRGAGVRVVHVPAAVENDVPGTDACLGADTALNALVRAVAAEGGPAILEVPGRLTGYLALLGAALSGAAGALVVERPFPWARLGARLDAGARPVLLRAEGAGAAAGAEARFREVLGGKAPRVASLVAPLRTEPPSAFDRLAAMRLGESAARVLLSGDSGRAIALRAGVCLPVPLEEAAGRRRQVAPEVFEVAKRAGVLFE